MEEADSGQNDQWRRFQNYDQDGKLSMSAARILARAFGGAGGDK